MGVSSQDWPDLQLLAERYPEKVQPCFGIHPWKAHLHASSVSSGSIASVLEPRPDDEQSLPPSLQSPLFSVCSHDA